jgi:glycyl-tRNA synthetase beta chain
MKPFLIEIGSEEIPARFISKGLALLKEALTDFFDTSSVEYGNISEYATPRRLAVYIEDVTEKQKDRTVEHLGPPKKLAFDEHGNPSRSLTGFARSLNINVNDLITKKTSRGEYVVAIVEEKGKPTKDILSESLPEIISTLRLPKSMRWGSGSLRYFRPIQWILALLGTDIIPFQLDGIKSTNISYGHRFLSPSAIKVKDSSRYPELLKKYYVIADIKERKKIISEGIKKIEPLINCNVNKDDELLDIVTNLVEYPTVISGEFDKKYLGLPRELLTTVMKSHQKYFSTENNDGTMQPFFIVVSNTKPGNNDTVKKGAERVLMARLEDARFYFNEDLKKPLWDYVEELKKVTFQEKLGSVYEKTERIAFICSYLADVINLPDKEKLLRAAMLSKADLVTGIVSEFPELQGYMGLTYASISGEDKDVSSSCLGHYLPRFQGDNLPSSDISTLISLADKMDNIASFFFAGLIPTGSEDPFALRRQATGIINILQSREGYDLSLDTLIERALQAIESYLPTRKALKNEISKFFYQRLEGILLNEGFSYDLVNSVLSARAQNLKDVKNRIKIFSQIKKEPGFSELLIAAKRVYNILSKTQPAEVKEDLLFEAAEKELFIAVKTVNDKLTVTDYKALFELKNPVNTFFDSILVMDKKPEVRENRLALLLSVKRIFDSLGDFSKIVQ